MKITHVKVNKFTNGKLRAFADVTFDSTITIKGYKVFEGSNGMFVSGPSRQDKDGKYYDIVWVEDQDFMKEIQKSVLKFYEDAPDASSNRPSRGGRSNRVADDPNEFGPSPL
tara:strand:+ start:6540 stop:6875 length:336 start_codon:yes stop_codon:yes gene_type:complete